MIDIYVYHKLIERTDERGIVKSQSEQKEKQNEIYFFPETKKF